MQLSVSLNDAHEEITLGVVSAMTPCSCTNYQNHHRQLASFPLHLAGYKVRNFTR